MPFIDTTPASAPVKITEGEFQDNFVDLLVANTWTKEKDFYRTAYYQESGTTGNTDVVMARHTIFRNTRGNMFGLAILATKTGVPNADFPTAELDRNAWIKAEHDAGRTNTTLHYYMLEKLPTFAAGAYQTVVWNKPTGDTELTNLRRMALDIEVSTTEPEVANSTTYKVKTADPLVMQSPIVVSSIRATFIENINYPYQETNWWPDSEIRVQGFLDANDIFLIMQSDNVPAWENNLVPTVPFYFGQMDPTDPGDNAVALFAGTMPDGDTIAEVASFDYNSTLPTGEQIMPILKNYPSHPSNGIDSVMVSRAKFGARYQEYFLSWNTASNEMPPDRANDDDPTKQYPRAWNNLHNVEYKYQFNPSRYSGKVHTSKIYLVHPEEGVRGSLAKTIGLSALNFNAGKLRIRQAHGPSPVYDVYRFFVVGAVSPLTKRPATAFRPVGIGIFDSVYDPANP